MEAITLPVEEDGSVRIPHKFVSADPGQFVLVRRDQSGKFEIHLLPEKRFEDLVAELGFDESMTWERAVEEGQEIAAREAMGLGGTRATS
jgi:hypothetical protein